MKELIPRDEYGVFVNMKRDTVVCSLDVARWFKKDHNLVLRAIRGLSCSEEFRLCNFAQSSYINEQNKKQPCYYMKRDGFIFLVMGFTGKEAAQIKEAYIRSFSAMENFLSSELIMTDENLLMNEQIKAYYGEGAKPYHFSNEYNMIHRIVLGMSAKEYKLAHGVPADEKNLARFLTLDECKLESRLRTLNTGMLFLRMDYKERKTKLIEEMARLAQQQPKERTA